MKNTALNVFRNDMVMLSVRMKIMRENKLITNCPECMKKSKKAELCTICHPNTNNAIESALTSQSEWDE